MNDHPFSSERLAALSRLSAEINAQSAPPPIAEPVLIDEAGMVRLPVPHFDPPLVVDLRGRGVTAPEPRYVSAELHAGLTLRWAPMPGGVLIAFRGGAPDGDETRDAVAVFLTERGIGGLIADLQAIHDGVRAEA